MIFDGITDAIGHTPLVRLRVPAAPGVEVYAKLELQNLFGMKDRVAATIITEARRTGALVEGAHIVESSSGTMALGVALVGTALGHPVHIVTDPRVDRMTLAKLRALGCAVHVVDAMTSHGWQSARLERLEQLMAELPGAFWPQQYSNPDNPAAYRRLAEEVLRDLGTVDVLVGSVGSGGSLCGSSRALRESLPGLLVLGVDCVGSALFDQPDEPRRLQSGLGNSLLPKNLDRTLVDEVHWLNDHEAFAATRALAAEQQIFAGNTSGSVYRVLTDVAARSAPGTRIVGIFPDRGDRYADTVYSDEFWASSGLTDLPVASAPEPVDYGTVVTGWSRAANKSGADVPRHLLFVEANTTGTGVLALGLAGELGLTPVLLTGDPSRYAGLAGSGAEVLECDTNSAAALRAAVQDRFRREEVAGVSTTSDFYTPAAADLAAWLGLPRNPVDAVLTCRDKSLLRACLAAAGVRQPGHVVLREPVTGDDAARAVAAVGLPCVVKPVDDSGSNAVLLCHDADQVLAHARRVLAVRENVRGLPTARSVLVEEFLPGEEFSVELFGWAGRTHPVGVTRKSVTPGPHFVETRHLFPAPLDPALADEVVAVARRAVEAAGMRLGATHTEVRLTPDGPAVVEVNPRLAGGMIPELVRLATGVELLAQQVRAAAGLPPDLAPSRAAHAGIAFLTAPRAGVLAEVTGVEAARAVPGVEHVLVTAAPGAAVRPPENAYDRLGHVIALGATPAEVDAALTAAHDAVGIRLEAGQ
ncbi:pyridoxal-phosphate dependent enzyme [Actinosynnema pretiosum]|uniref:Pyridoxal-5'-phosphate-dependent protein n=1 Tax=Actinosynnema pretiosum TaxID=42197 RepID=A0A290Z9P9_9PSEU|nr:pyridoxal-phosphate dependent enzyme [Actinosynnema pretiosum]ATE55699.1 pyridoxal-5'-phosphate-dependent protein [Actinosynnema pretiosum]